MTAVDGMDDELKELVCNYMKALEKIQDWKKDMFPTGTVVYVEHDSYKGFGIVVSDMECYPTKVPVRLQNDNIWWYSVLCVTPATRRPVDWPDWIKREKKI